MMEHASSIEVVNDAYRAFVTPLVVVLGVTGNMLIVVVLCRQQQQQIRRPGVPLSWGRFETYCGWLAVLQTLALISNSLLDDFLGRGLYFITGGKVSLKLDQLGSGSVGCKMMEFVPRVCYFGSSYLICAMSLDRVLVLSWPAFPPPHSHGLRCKLLCSGIVLVGIALCCPYISFFRVDHEAYLNKHFNNISCSVISTAASQMMLYCESLLFYVVPLVFVLSCNCVIGRQISRRRQLRQRLSSHSSSTPKSAMTDNNAGSMKLIGYLALSSAFSLVTLPLAVIIIVRSVLTSPFNKGSKQQLTISLSETSKLASSIKDIHYAINFYLNLIFLQRFRSDVQKLCCRSSRQETEHHLLTSNRNITKCET